MVNAAGSAAGTNAPLPNIAQLLTPPANIFNPLGGFGLLGINPIDLVSKTICNVVNSTAKIMKGVLGAVTGAGIASLLPH